MTDALTPTDLTPSPIDRRFSGVGRLYGEASAQRLRDAHCCVVGIGGVGSWTVEALARSGVGRLTLIDLDVVGESNTNRQLHALDPDYGMAKVEAMARRVRAINPQAEVKTVDDFVTEENIEHLLGDTFSVVIDAIDQTKVKLAMILHCRARGLPLVLSGAAGGKTDPTLIRREDLSKTTQDPILAKIRSQLRRHHSYPKDPKKKFGIQAIYSSEPMKYPDRNESCDLPTGGPAGLNCAGFGSSVCVTSVFGMTAAAAAIEILRGNTP